MQGCAAFGASAVLLPRVSILEASEPKGETRVFRVKNSYNLKSENPKLVTKLWIPLPLQSEYQHISDIKFSSNASKAYITDKNSYHALAINPE